MAITRQIAIISDQGSLSEDDRALFRGARALATDTGYIEALEYMQQGQWQQVLPMLRLLKAQYPDAAELDSLMKEASLRSEFEASWGDKVKGKRTGVSVGRVMSRVVPVLLIGILLVAGIFYFNRLRSLNTLAAERQALQEQANVSLEAGQYEEAIGLFNQLLTADGENAVAQRGKAEAEKQLALAQEYNLGVDAMAVGDVATALNFFKALHDHAPGYRDVAQRIGELEAVFAAEEIFAAAEVAFQNRQWTQAIQKYEALRQQDSTYQENTVIQNLIRSYTSAGQEIIEQSPDQGADPTLAQQYFRRVLKLQIDEPTAKAEADLLEGYFAGERAFRAEEYGQAESLLRPIYDERPEYLGGYLAQSLYESYVQLGDQALQKVDYKTALNFYNQAAQIHVSDASTALMGAYRASAALTPTPTPTFTPTPTLTPTITPSPAPTATPKPLPIEAYKGWILFRSDRDGGGGFYLMQPDGSQVRPAPLDAGDKIDEMYRQAAWSPDGNSQLYVKKEREDGEDVNVYKLRHDLPETWRRRFDMAVFSRSQYDPVWDPSNYWIAFVSNHTGNDEIWIMDTEGQNHKQLTFNTWEWDKHPSWSLDGQQIAFFSNRTGPKQIWIMNKDGTGQINISNNEYNDWDPTFITGKPVPPPQK